MQRGIKYWVNVVSKDHTQRGVSGGFMQSCHGKQGPLKRMQKDDWVIFYSPKDSMQGTIKCQAFTAIGQVKDDLVYSFQMTDDFIPFRRNVSFQSCTEVPIVPLISQLSFIRDKRYWGAPFRFGFFEISEDDFNLISKSMIDNG